MEIYSESFEKAGFRVETTLKQRITLKLQT
jgi:hypothetical protein